MKDSKLEDLSAGLLPGVHKAWGWPGVGVGCLSRAGQKLFLTQSALAGNGSQEPKMRIKAGGADVGTQ